MNDLNAGRIAAATALGFGLFWIVGSLITLISRGGYLHMGTIPMHPGPSSMMGDTPVFLSGFGLTILAAVLVWLVVTIYNRLA